MRLSLLSKRAGLTIPELLVVITIMSILSTIGFISYTRSNIQARDVVRSADIKNISKVLALQNTQISRYPSATSPIDVTYSGAVVWSQGVFGKDSTRETGKIFGELKDPKTGNQYTYSVTGNKKEYQLSAIFENEQTASTLTAGNFTRPALFPEAYAATDFSPLELSPTIWLDGKDIDGDGDINDNPGNNTDVTAWVNKSSAGSANNPTLTSGNLKYSVDGYDSTYPGVFIANSRGLLLNNSDITQGDIFYVVQNNDPFGSTDNNGLGLQSSSNNQYSIGYWWKRRYALRIGNAPKHHNVSPATTSSRTDTYIYGFHTDNLNYSFRDTGVSISGGATNSITGHEWAFNTAGANTSKADWVVSEILIFDSSLSSDDRKKVEGYLAHKWGQENWLSFNHPYKSAPPEGSTPPTPDTQPDAYTFGDVSDANISTLYTSNAITISGINTAAPISISSGEYSVNSTSTYTTSAGNVSHGDIIRVRQTSSASSNSSTTTTLNIGGVTENFVVTTFTVDNTPDTISFNPVNNADVSTTYTSNSITISGLNTQVPINISGPSATYKVSDGIPVDVTGTGSASANDFTGTANDAFDNNTSTSGWGNQGSLPSRLQYDFGGGNKQLITKYTLHRSSNQPGGWYASDSPKNWTFEGSNNASDWDVLDTRTNEYIYNNNTKKEFSFTNSSYYRYYRINISASNTNDDWVNITEMEIMKGEGVGLYTSASGTVSNGDIISVRMPSSSSPGTLTTATLNVGSSSSNYTITTVAADTTPENFSFTDETGAAPNTVFTSNTITVNGINSSSPISISGSGSYSINGGAYTSVSGNISNMDTVSVRLTSPSGPSNTSSTILTIGGVSAGYNISTPAPPPDSTPDTFTFIDLSDAALATQYVSNTITVSGINTTASISISNGEYEKNGLNSYTTTSGTVVNGDTISVRGTSSASAGNTTNVILTVGGVQDTYTITTIAPDVTPDAFSISNISDAMVNTMYISDVIVINGINTSIDISVSLGEYSINGGSWSSSAQSGVVNNGDELRVRNVSDANWGTPRSMSLTVGGVTADFVITTGPGDTTPDIFSFNDITDANLNSQYISDSITITGINAESPISIIGGEYTIGTSGSYTSSPGTVNNGDSVRVRLVSSIAGLTTTSATLTIGGINDSYDVSTENFIVQNDETPTAAISNVFVGGDYNGLISYAHTGSIHYIFATPSIISSDLADTNILSIIKDKKLVYDGFKNTPASYTGANSTLTGGFDFAISSPILYEGSREDLGSYGGLKQIDEGIRSTYNNFPAYQNVASYLDDYSLGYLEQIIGQNIGINPIKPFYCSDILRSKLIYNVAPNAKITATPNTVYGGFGTSGIANGVTSTVGDLDFEYHSDTGNGQITFEWEKSQKIGYVRIYNRTGCCSSRLSGASIQLYNQFGGIIYTHTLWDTTNDYVVDLDLEGIGHLYDVNKLVIQTVGGNHLNLREVEIFLGGNVESGVYKVDKDGLGGASPYNVYCDMETEGGGWTRIGEDFITNGNFYDQDHVGEHTFSGYDAPNDNLIVSNVVEAPPSTLPDASVLQHNGSVSEGYELYFPSIPGEFFAQEIRLSAWVKGTSSSIFNNTINYEDGSSATTTPEYEVLNEVDGWQYRMSRIPLSGLVKNFTWDAGTGTAGTFYVTGMKMEVYYR